MKKFNNFELLLYAAAEECIEQEAEEFLAIDTSEVEGKLTKEKQLAKRIRYYKKQACKNSGVVRRYPMKTIIKAAIAAVLCGALLSLAACMSIKEVRTALFKTVVKWYDQYISISFERVDDPADTTGTTPEQTEPTAEPETEPPVVSTITPPTTIEAKAYASYLPDTYSCTVDGESERYYMVSYYDMNEEWKFALTQTIIETGNHYEDSENKNIEKIQVNAHEAILIKDENTSNFYQLIWQDSYYEYTINGFFSSVDELIDIAEGIKLQS